MNFPPAVEQWRPIIKQYFKPEDVDKALWVVMHESGGSPAAVGDGGASLGIWQLNSRGLGAGMSAAQRGNPIAATKRAAEAVYGGQGWKPWGENNLYKGKKFGALGNHPFPGSSGADPKQGRAMTSRVLPVSKGRITQVFGPTNEKLDSGGVNKGLDIGVPVGTPVKSVTGGTVVHVGDAGDGWGTSVKVRDAQGNIHNYGHLSAAAVKKGASVRAGQNIAKSGNTGASTGPHLSYDVKGANGQYVDPSPWLGFNARGDNRKGHPAIGKDISEMSQESSGPWMTFWRDQVPDAQARVQSAEEQLRIIQAMPDTPGGSRGRLLELAQNQLQMAQGNLETVMMNAQAEEQNAANSQVDEFGNYIDSERVAQGWEGVAQGWAELGISEIHAQVAQGRLSLDRAVAQINERLGKQQESRARAQFVAEELDQARKWAPQEPGKTDYTGSDVSEAHGTALAQRGITPDQPVVKYSGTAQVDPQSILAQQDEYMGVGQKGSAP
ncbi:MAG: peptidoglycan DD-metalloendopeptidase family protein, partial [Myxococcota bacterium]